MCGRKNSFVSFFAIGLCIAFLFLTASPLSAAWGRPNTVKTEPQIVLNVEPMQLLKESAKQEAKSVVNETKLADGVEDIQAVLQDYNTELRARGEENEALLKDVNRLHLGLGFGTVYAPAMNPYSFGVEAVGTFRVKNWMLMFGVQHDDVKKAVKSFDVKDLNYKMTILYEF